MHGTMFMKNIAYGQRRQGNEEFLNSNMADFRKNMVQLILDMHLLRNYLETRPNGDIKKLNNVFRPLLTFVVDDALPPNNSCAEWA